MCICLNCSRLKDCRIYDVIQSQHQEKNTINEKFFHAQSPILISLTSYSSFTSIRNLILVEWDVSECLSYQDTPGNWVYTNKEEKIFVPWDFFDKFPSYLVCDVVFD